MNWGKSAKKSSLVLISSLLDLQAWLRYNFIVGDPKCAGTILSDRGCTGSCYKSLIIVNTQFQLHIYVNLYTYPHFPFLSPISDVHPKWYPLPLIQVHRAVLKSSGKEVAVKVQHAAVQEHSKVDTITIEVNVILLN